MIKTDNRNLIIDTGFNRKECLEAMQKGLQELDIDLHQTDFFITHLHADHFGLVSKLVTETSRLYFNRPEMELIEAWEGFEPMIAFAGKMVSLGMTCVRLLRHTLETNSAQNGFRNWKPCRTGTP